MKHGATIQGLEQAIHHEKAMVAAYRHAAERPPHNGQKDLLFVIEESHLAYAVKLDARVKALHKMDGDGFLGMALHDFREAIADVVAGLPVNFVQSTTTNTVEMLRRSEEELIRHYETVRSETPTGDVDSLALIDAAIAACRNHLDVLAQIEAV